jgi:hypothetical protein
MAEVFQFRTSASLERLTGRRAYTLEGLLDMIKTCSESSIFFHTFSAFMKMREVQLPYNSDFSIWVSRSLNEKALAEKLTAVDFGDYEDTEALRVRIIELIESHRSEKPAAFQKVAEEPFYLYDMVRVVYLTDKFAYDLRSFRELLEKISIYSIFYHFFESRLRSRLGADDFSTWLDESLGLAELARKVREIDVSVHTLEGLRSRIIELIDAHEANRKRGGRGRRCAYLRCSITGTWSDRISSRS